MATARLVHTETLANGLSLAVYDCSRPMAGDRWQVILEVRLAVPVTPATVPPDLADRLPEVLAALGPEPVFSKQEVRHFIDAREVAGILAEMQTRLLQGLRAYLGHPDFAGRFLGRKFTEHQEQRRWRQE